jgi:hypothetical protein
MSGGPWGVVSTLLVHGVCISKFWKGNIVVVQRMFRCKEGVLDGLRR